MKERISLLGLSASPRKNGNSTFLLDEALQAAESFEAAEVATERFEFAGKRMSPCIGCYGCIDAKGECILKDDFQALRDLWVEADAVVCSIPIFAMSLPGQLKCFFDRLANSLMFREDASHNPLKAVGTISQGMHFAAGQESVIRDMANISMLLGCLPVAGESYNGVRGWTYDKLSRSTLKKAAEAGDDATIHLLSESRHIVTHLLTVALLIRSGARANDAWLAGQADYASLRKRVEQKT